MANVGQVKTEPGFVLSQSHLLLEKLFNLSLILPSLWYKNVGIKKENIGAFSGSALDKNLPASSGDTGSIPGQGRFHTPD